MIKEITIFKKLNIIKLFNQIFDKNPSAFLIKS